MAANITSRDILFTEAAAADTQLKNCEPGRSWVLQTTTKITLQDLLDVEEMMVYCSLRRVDGEVLRQDSPAGLLSWLIRN